MAALPNTRGRASEVVIPAGHVVDYGHSILQDIRLAAATDAAALAAALRDGSRSIRAMTTGLARGRLVFELMPLSGTEIDVILACLEAASPRRNASLGSAPPRAHRLPEWGSLS